MLRWRGGGERGGETERETETDRDRDRETETDRDTDTERHRDRATARQSDSATKRDRERARGGPLDAHTAPARSNTCERGAGPRRRVTVAVSRASPTAASAVPRATATREAARHGLSRATLRRHWSQNATICPTALPPSTHTKLIRWQAEWSGFAQGPGRGVRPL